MATLDGTERAKVPLAAGDTIRISTTGQCTVQGLSGAPSTTTTLTAQSQDFGPYGVAAVLLVQNVSGRTDYSLNNATYPLNATEKRNFDSLVSTHGNAIKVGIASKPRIKFSRLGDSISAHDIPLPSSGVNGPRANSIGFWVQALSLGRLHHWTTRATSGFTIAQIRDTHLPSILTDRPDVCIVLAGANDSYSNYGALETPEVLFARLRDEVWTPLVNAGIVVVACTLTLSASRTTTLTAAQHVTGKKLSALIRAADGSMDGMVVVADVEQALASAGANEGADITRFVGTEVTYLHPNDSGSMMAARVIWDALSQYAGLLARGNELQGLMSPYSLGTNVAQAGNNATGTNGTSLGTGITGTAPDDFVATRSGTSTAVISTTPRTDGRPGNLTVIAATIGGSGEYIAALQMNSSGLYNGGTGSTSLRQNSTVYRSGMIRRFGASGDWYKVVQPGTSAAAEPSPLPSDIGGLVLDGTAMWMRMPSLLAGGWVRMAAEVMVTAHSVERAMPHLNLRQYTAAAGALSSGCVFEANGAGEQMTAGNGSTTWGIVGGTGTSSEFGMYPGAWPLNRWVRLETPWQQIHPECGLIGPGLRIVGQAGAQMTLQVGYCDLQLRP